MSSNDSEERVLSSSPAASGAKSESVRIGGVVVAAGWGLLLREAAAAAAVAGASFAASDEAFAAAAALSLDCLLVVTLHVASKDEDPGVVSVAADDGAALQNGDGRDPKMQVGVKLAAASSMFFAPRSLLLPGGVALGAAWRIVLLLVLLLFVRRDPLLGVLLESGSS